MKQGIRNLDMMSKSVNDLLEMGDPAPVFKFERATLLLGKYDANELSDSRISTGQGKLKFPQQIMMSDINNCAAQKVRNNIKFVLTRNQNQNKELELCGIHKYR